MLSFNVLLVLCGVFLTLKPYFLKYFYYIRQTIKINRKNMKQIIILLSILLPFFSNAISTYYPVKNDTSKSNRDTIVPGPVFYTGINFDDFKYKIKRFVTVPEIKYDYAELSEKHNFFEPYYSGEPFTEGMTNFVYVNEAYRISKIDEKKYFSFAKDNGDSAYYPQNQVVTLPKSVIYYLKEYEVTNSGKISLDNVDAELLSKIIRPFYFSKYEVSVSEYKKFTEWVRKVNGFDTEQYKIETKNIDKQIKKTRIIWLTPKEKVYSYKFFNISDELKNEYKDTRICVAPVDSIEVFEKAQNTTGNYNVNPFYLTNRKYSKYPVMGISYFQALAFLDWKQHFFQLYLDKNNANLEVEYSLPNLMDYELALGFDNDFIADNWICNLELSKRNSGETNLGKILNSNILRTIYKESSNNYENTPVITDITSKRLNSYEEKKYKNREFHKFTNEIEWLDGNVSEWLADAYKTNWQKAYEAHKQFFDKNSEADKLASEIEDFYNKKNDKNGHLVIGANYLDYRQSMIYSENDGKLINKAGINAKRFVNPNVQYSTLGFRYVIRVKHKDESRKDSLLRIVGTFDYKKYKDFPMNYKKYFNTFVNKDKIQKGIDEWRIEYNIKKEFLVLKNEVTNGMWRTFIIDLLEKDSLDLALKYLPKDSLWEQYNDMYLYYFKDLKYDNYPVVNISHEAVKRFNRWITEKNNLGKSFSNFYLLKPELWNKVAKAYNKDSLYAWGNKDYKEYKTTNLANINTPISDSIYNYVSKNLYKYTTNDKLSVKFGQIPEKYAKIIYKNNYKDAFAYNKFLERSFVFSKYPAIQPVGTTKLKNKIGLSDLHGNVSEMTDTFTIVKGGSWNDYLQNSTLNDVSSWNGSPSPTVGFRIAMDKPQIIDSIVFSKLMTRIPPGTILLTPNFGVDVLEMRNIDYLKFLRYIRTTYGPNSKKYKELLPDKNVWKTYEYEGRDLSEVYFNNKDFYNHPLVGVTYNQAVAYCEWRTMYVNNLYRMYHMKYKRSIGVPKKVHFRLPTPEEWDRILKTDSIYMPDEGYVHPDYKNPYKNSKKLNEKINIGLTSSVFYFWKNKIGLYAIDDNVSEMTSVPGVAKGCNWTDKGSKKTQVCHYNDAENWVGFRCVVDVEY